MWQVYDTEEDFIAEREYFIEAFTPLVEKCKKLNRAMRIGTNHGSLSARILSFYGDTPRGMVESAIEFADICRSLDYHNFVFSMKASNPLVMVQAYRLLAAEQYRLGWDYPLHLGASHPSSLRFSPLHLISDLLPPASHLPSPPDQNWLLPPALSSTQVVLANAPHLSARRD